MSRHMMRGRQLSRDTEHRKAMRTGHAGGSAADDSDALAAGFRTGEGLVPRLDQLIDRNDVIRTREESAEEHPLLRTTKVEQRSIPRHLDRAEDAKVHRWSCLSMFARATGR